MSRKTLKAKSLREAIVVSFEAVKAKKTKLLTISVSQCVWKLLPPVPNVRAQNLNGFGP